jgi:hypothetical protein
MATATLSKKEWPFAPQAVNNCLLWLDAADESSYTPGASISTWRNKGYSGGSATATGTVGSTSADINGLSGMAFATNAYMTAPSMTFTQTTRTVFVVVTIGASGTLRRFMCSTGSNTIDSFILTAGTNLEFNYNGNINYITDAPYPIFNTTSMMCGTTLSTNGGIFVNGLAQTPYSTNTPAAFGTGTTTTQTIGFSTSGTFVLGEAMIFDGAITDIQRQQVEGYLAAKWGLQSLLPVTHPYYTLYNLLTYAFEPTQIPTCALWLDASDATSITGTSVSRWLDKSGNGNNMSLTAGTVTYVSNPGPPCVNITSGGILQTSTYTTITASQSIIFIVCQATAVPGGSFGYVFACSDINGGDSSIRFFPNTTTLNDGFAGTTFYVNGVSYTSGTNSLTTGYNLIDTIPTGQSGSTRFSLSSSFFGRYFIGNIREVIVYTGPLTTNQRQSVESYLGAKWNIAVAGQGSVAPVANPLSISGCQLWLDAADATTIVPVVSTWRDKSGLGNNMALTAGTVTYVSNPGPPCVNFASGGILQTSNYISIASGVSVVFVVCQATTMSSPFNMVFACTDINGGDTSIRFYLNVLSIKNDDSNDLGFATGYYINGVLSNSNLVTVPTGYNMIGVLVNRSGTTRFSLSSSFGGRFFIGNIREVIVYTGPITTNQRLQVENYLMAKWGTGRNFWIDASDATTVTRGTTVTRWLDKSGNGNNATTLNSTVTYSAAGLAFNGSAYMSVPGIAGTLVNTPFVIFIVETLGATGSCFYFGDDNVNAGGAFGYSLHTGYRESNNQTFAMYGSDLEDTTVSGTGNKRIWALYLPTASNRNTRRNGTVDATFSNYNRLLAFTAPVIGRVFGGSYYVGTISEIIVYNQDIGLTAIQQIETYLGNKWGIAVTTSVPGVTNPTLIPGCVLWLDSADPAALVTAVSQMNDKSGNGYNITQATATYQPTLTNNYLALGTSLNYYMNMPQAAINNTSSWTLFLVFNPVSTNNWIFLKQFDGNNTYNILSMGYSQFGTSGTAGVVYFKALNAGTLFTGPAALTTSTNQLLTMIYNGTNIYYYVNGVLAAITNGTFTIQNVTNATNATLGAFIASGTIANSGVTNFQLGELSFYNSALTTIQTQEIAASLMNKWSITNTLETANGSLADTPFFPTDITGCALWLDGADTSSMTMTGTTISQWNDKSGNARNATVASGKTAATYSIASNCVYFPASDTGYVTSYPANPTNETMFVVFNNAAPTLNNNILIGGQLGARSLGAGYSGANGSTSACAYLNNEVAWLSTTPAGSYTVGTTALVTGYISSGTTFITLNGGTFSSGVAASFAGGTTTYLGVDTTTPAYYYIGFVMEIIFYNSVLSTAQIAQVNQYLKNKWNIAPTLTTLPTPVYNRPFQPVDIPGCQLWLDAADTSSNSITFSSGTTVSAWLDKSGNGNNGTANTGVAWAASGMGTNLPAMTFTNTQWFLGNISITGATMTVFGVISMSASSPFAARMIALAAPNANDYNNPAYVGILRQSSNNMGPYRNGNYPSVTFSYNTPTLLSTWYDGTNANISANGALTPSSSGSSGNFTISSYAVAANTNLGDIGAASFYGYMSELIVYNFSLSTSQRQQVEAYLSWKWNLRSSLPATHPGYTLPSFSTIFTPKSISGLTLWMDAADSSTMVFSSGTTVSTWRDKSGSGNNFSRVAGTITYTTTTTGYPGLYFPSGSTGMTSAFNAAVNGNSSRTYFFVADVPSGCRALIGTGPMQGASPPNTLGFDSAKNANTIWSPFVYTGSDITFSPLAATTTINYAAYNSAVSILYGNYNTTTSDITRSTTLNTSATVWYLGNRPDGNTPINSYVCEFIEFNTYLTTSQRQQVEGYLAWKWGVQSSLPTRHAFKKFKP